MAQTLVEPTLLFEFAIMIARMKQPTKKVGSKKVSAKATADSIRWQPDESNLIPHFAALSGRATHSTVYAAWSEFGLHFVAHVQGKTSPSRFVQSRGGFSDGLRIWIDTRCSPGVHRATRFCHCFHFFPGQAKSNSALTDADNPHGILDEIPRAREQPAKILDAELQVESECVRDGYTLWAHVPTSCLTGYSPLEFDRIRIFYDVVDHELGTQSMTLGPELRYAEDPSLWVQATLK